MANKKCKYKRIFYLLYCLDLFYVHTFEACVTLNSVCIPKCISWLEWKSLSITVLVLLYGEFSEIPNTMLLLTLTGSVRVMLDASKNFPCLFFFFLQTQSNKKQLSISIQGYIQNYFSASIIWMLFDLVPVYYKLSSEGSKYLLVTWNK